VSFIIFYFAFAIESIPQMIEAGKEENSGREVSIRFLRQLPLFFLIYGLI
jgi:hypothetical protein